jgi:hypothetical protein
LKGRPLSALRACIGTTRTHRPSRCMAVLRSPWPGHPPLRPETHRMVRPVRKMLHLDSSVRSTARPGYASIEGVARTCVNFDAAQRGVRAFGDRAQRNRELKRKLGHVSQAVRTRQNEGHDDRNGDGQSTVAFISGNRSPLWHLSCTGVKYALLHLSKASKTRRSALTHRWSKRSRQVVQDESANAGSPAVTQGWSRSRCRAPPAG